MITNNVRTITFDEPTDIIVCDPCYIFTHEVPELHKAWQEMCEEWHPESDDPVNTRKHSENADGGTIEYEDAKVLYTSTAYGDGTYKITHCPFDAERVDDIGVDAGMLCVAKLSDVNRIYPDFDIELACVIRGFKGTINSTGEGFDGDIILPTDGSDEEEEESDDED